MFAPSCAGYNRGILVPVERLTGTRQLSLKRGIPMRKLALLTLPLLLLAVSLPAQELPVSPGDRLVVTVAEEKELTGTYTVDQEGAIVLALINKVPVAGKSLPQVRDELTRRLAEFVRDPQVRVEFGERAQLTIGFTGMVQKPGSVRLPQGSRLLDGLALTGGLVVPGADDEHVRLQRRGEPAPRILDLRRLSKDAALNLELKDGDQIHVPPIPMNVVRVLGAVNKPGEFARKETIPLLDAIGLAGGLAENSDRRRLHVLRKGASEPDKVSLDDVLSGKANVLLQDGDTVTILAIPQVTVKVFGQVAKPGQREMKEGTTVLEAITEAGGFAMDADKAAVFVMLPGDEVRKVNLAKLDSPDGGLALPSGARVFVPEQAPLRYAVAGGVHEPGVFPFPQGGTQKIYLSDALAQGKGPIDRAKKKTIALVRRSPNGGQPMVQQINFEAYLKKKDPSANPEILPGDVVYVDAEPDGEKKPSLLERVLGIASRFIF